MQIVQPTTASQIFHILRRQMVRNLRKPLVIMTPQKSLLRNKDAASPLTEFTKGEFQTVIPSDAGNLGRQGQARHRVLGKVYYDLVRRSARSEGRRRGDHPRRAALPVPAQGSGPR